LPMLRCPGGRSGYRQNLKGGEDAGLNNASRYVFPLIVILSVIVGFGLYGLVAPVTQQRITVTDIRSVTHTETQPFFQTFTVPTYITVPFYYTQTVYQPQYYTQAVWVPQYYTVWQPYTQTVISPVYYPYTTTVTVYMYTTGPTTPVTTRFVLTVIHRSDNGSLSLTAHVESTGLWPPVVQNQAMVYNRFLRHYTATFSLPSYQTYAVSIPTLGTSTTIYLDRNRIVEL